MILRDDGIETIMKKCRIDRFVSLLFLSLFFHYLSSTFVRAQEVDSTEVLESSMVTSHGAGKTLLPVQALIGKELESMNAYSIADAVRYFSGVQIKDYGGIGGLKTINIRSMGSRHVGVFYDGVEVTNAQNGIIDLGRFSLYNMESVSLLNGQKSDLLQTARDYASASSLYMRSRVPVFNKGQKNRFHANFRAGSFKTINPSFLWEHQFNGKTSASISSEYLYTSGQYRFSYAKKDGCSATGIRKNGDVSLARMEMSLFGKIQDGSWKTKVYGYHSERGYPGASVREEPGKFRHQDRQWDDNLFIQAQLKKIFSSAYSLMAHAKYAYDFLHYVSDPRLDVTTMYIDNRYHQQEMYVSVAQMFSLLPQWTLACAEDLQYNLLHANLPDFVYPRRFQSYTSLASSLNLKWLKIQGSLLFQYVQDRTRNNKPEARDRLSPALILSIRPFYRHDFHIRTFYKRNFRMPTLNDLYYTFIGGIHLEPEQADQYDLGVLYDHASASSRLKKWNLQIDGYYNQVQNKIVAIPTSNQFRWTMVNFGKVHILGCDVSAGTEMQWGDFQQSVRLGYCFQKAQDYTNPESPWYKGQIPYTPWHSGNIVLNASFRKWNLHYSFLYTGERYESVANIPENHADPWSTHDLSVSRSFTLKRCFLKATLEGNNILNRQYEAVRCYPMPGAYFMLKVNIIV